MAGPLPPRGCLLRFHGYSAVFCLVCLGFVFAILVWPHWRVNHRYVEAECEVLDKRIVENRNREGGTTYRAEFRIRYPAQGQVHDIWTFDADRTVTSTRAPQQRIFDRFEVGQRYPCWYDPDDPGRAVLVRGYPWIILVFVLPILVLLGIDVAAIANAWRKPAPATQPQGATAFDDPLRPNSDPGAELRRAPSFGDLARIFWFTIAHRHKSPEWRDQEALRRFPELAEAEVLDQAKDEAGVSYPCIPKGSGPAHPGSVLRVRLDDEPEPEDTLAGLLLFNVIWNGVVLVFVVHAAEGVLLGDPEWGTILLLIPFALIGLGMFLWLIRKLLIKYGIGPTTLEIETHPLRPGQTVEILARQSGSLSLNALKVALVCEEVAKYREGTSTRTETHRVFETPLFHREGFEIPKDSPFEARCALQVPEGAMHSFEGGNNTIVWKVVVKGDVANWPDFERAFPIVVLPEESKDTWT